MKRLYAHQERLIIGTRQAIAEGHRQVILVSPTGSGKAVTLAEIARLHLSKGGTKVLVVAHRKELIEQLYDTFEDQTGLPVSAIMASASRLQYNPHRQLQIASVQSLLARDEMPDVSLVLLDEVHHHISDEWAKIHKMYPRVLTIGATATPCRSDGRAFGDWGFTKLIEGPTTEELTNLGLLAPMDVVAPSRVLKHKQVAMHPLDALKAHAADRKRVIIFAPNTATAEQYVTDFTAAGITSAFISYKSPDRAQMLKRFKSGELRVLVNLALVSEGFDEPGVDCMINCRNVGSIGLWRQMCLDEHTEILTRAGWRGIDDMVETDEVASVNISDMSSTWELPQSIIRRPLEKGEKMYSITSPRLNMRMIGDHDMVIRTRTAGWHKRTAETMSRRKSNYEIPSTTVQPSAGVPLTDAELRVIGWYMTDGWIDKSNNTLRITQIETAPFLHEIYRCLYEAGLKFTVYRKTTKNCFENAKPQVVFQVSYGMPRKLAEKHLGLKGWAHLAPFLDKDLAPGLEEMTPHQLGVLLEALHWGDGNKQAGQSWTQRSWQIATARKFEADRLQSLCARRGFSCNLSVAKRPFPYKDLYYIRVTHETQTRYVGGNGCNDRSYLREDITTPGERVWCVTVSTGAIIARRNGKIFVTGNCGRALRIAPGKESAILIDLVGVINLHGDHLEPLEYSLEGEGVRRARDPNAVRFCRVCSAVVEGAGLICEECNIGPAAQVVPTVSGDKLQRFARIRKRDTPARKAHYFRLLEAAEKKGHKLGSCAHRYNAVYSEMPPREWVAEYHRSKHGA